MKARSITRNVSRHGPISDTVIAMVAEAKGVDHLELDPLYTVIDADSLDSIFDSVWNPQSTAPEFSFSWEECRIRIHSDRKIVITPLTEANESPKSGDSTDK